MKKTKAQLSDSVLFLFLMTVVGGFLDVYTFVTRGGVFANTQTTNLAKLGIELSLLNWSGVLDCLYPVLGCIAGAMAAEHVKKFKTAQKPAGWHLVILTVQGIVLLIVGFVPDTVPHVLVNVSLSFITSFQLSAFRTLEGKPCNTTICTGNTRSVGQYLYAAIDKRTSQATKQFVKFSCVVFSFSLGAAIGALSSRVAGVKAVWVCCVIIAFLIAIIIRSPEEES